MQRPPQPNFHRSSSGSNLADMGLSTVRRSVSINPYASATTSRHSLAPGAFHGSQTPGSASLQRRSSVYSRPSNHGPVTHQSFFTQAPAPPGIPEDPRPLKNKTFQTKIGQELSEYLTQNNFELEMKHSLTQRSMTEPTSKDFSCMFQWLYRRIDPAYRFQKAIDQEVPPILKQLRYPYAQKITKSQLGAVGGQNWFLLLGMLHWMMQLAQMLENYGRGAYDDACAESGIDVSGDRIVFRFLFGAYQDWLAVGPDEDEENADQALVPHIQAMAAEFERSNAKYAAHLEEIEAENKTLRAEIEELERTAPDIAKLDKHFKILEEDKKKFEDYNANVQTKIDKYETRLNVLGDEAQRIEQELKAAEQERGSLQLAMDQQGLNVQDIDRMNTERERLEKNSDDAVQQVEDVSRKLLEKEVETGQKLEDLESIMKRYNSLGYQMSMIPQTAVNAKGTNYELKLNISESSNFSSSTSSRRRSPEVDRLVADVNLGHSPVHLLNLDLRGAVRAAFVTFRKEINEKRKTATDKNFMDRDILENVQEELSEKNNEIDTLNHRVRQARETYDALKESTQTAHTQSTSSIEKLEKELARMRTDMERGVLELEQREMEVGVAYEGMREEASRVQEELHGQVEKALEDIIKFKVHIQKGLEEFEGWVVDEVQAELDGGDELGAHNGPGAGDGDVFE